MPFPYRNLAPHCSLNTLVLLPPGSSAGAGGPGRVRRSEGGVVVGDGSRFTPLVCEAMVEVTDTTAPGEHAGSYDRAYAVYRSLYPKLEETFADLAEV